MSQKRILTVICEMTLIIAVQPNWIIFFLSKKKKSVFVYVLNFIYFIHSFYLFNWHFIYFSFNLIKITFIYLFWEK